MGSNEYEGLPTLIRDRALGIDLVLCSANDQGAPGERSLLYFGIEEVTCMQFAAGASALGDEEPGHEGSNAAMVVAPKTNVPKLDAERFCAAWGYRLPRVGDYSARPVSFACDSGGPKTELRGLFSKPHEWCHETWGEVDPAKRTNVIHLFSGYEGPPLPPEDAFDVVLEGDEPGTARFYSSVPELGWSDVGFRVVLDAENLRRVIGGEIRR